MIWAWLAILAACVPPWLIFGYPEAPVAVRLHPDHIVGGELSKRSENTFAEHLVAVRILDEKLLMPRFDNVVNDIVLVDARVALDLGKHPLRNYRSVHHFASRVVLSNESVLNRPFSSFFPANH
ncbi:MULTISPECIES: hypothetical protein [unclassified Pseudomonas]|uniref:hypothetical protein n=1 Tax=unclassified Pseudomonas TaxID=196821 RepID=UPI00244AAD08|nr:MULTISPECIES: hypothetical protein [unclassified Pseudomonas]MDH0304717.1 hypothetical protein [Pseudomonas sp. GD04091]MDH1986908.1 hypothetical protein [Pseudomonas sp. GD03689]